jgi:nicotinate phosphoribosyltransferase
MEKIIAMRRKPRGVRLDSGDLAGDSQRIRRRLDEVGWNDVQIFASGDLDEDRIESLVAAGAKIDAFGVGTALSTSLDAPALGVIYKLVEVEIGGTVRNSAKFSAAKITYPGRKQVFRRLDAQGRFAEDIIALEDERIAGAVPLLEPVVRAGARLAPAASLADAQARCLDQVAGLPAELRRLAQAPAYPVQHSDRLEDLLDEVRRRVERTARA